MKFTILAAALVLPALSFGQFSESALPPIGGMLQHTIGTSGRMFDTIGYPLNAKNEVLPLGLDFSYNYGLLIGSELDTNGMGLQGTVYGLGIWLTRKVGGDGMYFGIGAHYLMSDIRKPDFGGSFVIGWMKR